MTLTFNALSQFFHIDKLIYHSLDLSLYQLGAEIDGQEYLIVEDNGQAVKDFRLLALQKRCAKLPVKQAVIRHQSAYDEMIGQTHQGGNNRLEVPLGDNELY